ncbi:MAG: AMP-binding protein [Haliea sp.]|nr:AMP-binding protein [Haliea sp.]
MNDLLNTLTQRAAQSPESIVLENSVETVSVARLLQEVQSLAAVLSSSGFARVALLADNSPNWVRVDLAAQLAEVCLVPIPTFFSAGQREHILRVAGIEAVVVSDQRSASMTSLPGAQAARRLRTGLLMVPFDGAAVGGAIPAGTAKITFTSGSTADPKGVCLSTEQCLRVAQSLMATVGVATPRHLSLLPLSTLLENIAGVYWPLLAGGRVVLPAPDELGLAGSSGIEPKRLLTALKHWNPQTLIVIPQLLTLFDQALLGGWQPPPALEFIAVGGARVAPDLLRRARDGGLPVYEGYGLSECASVVSLNTPQADRAGTSGRVLPHVEVSVRNGELMVDGNRFLGYLDDPPSWHPGPVPTGDLGHLDAQGYLSVSGRRKHVLISSFGRNISPEWVESELLADGCLRQVVVLGDDRPFCVALVYPAQPDCSDAAIEASVTAANMSLPDYARVGAWIRLLHPLSADNALLTENGRPRRALIAEHFYERVALCYSLEKEILAS